jgi:hypothetical protein
MRDLKMMNWWERVVGLKNSPFEFVCTLNILPQKSNKIMSSRNYAQPEWAFLQIVSFKYEIVIQ